MSTEQVKPATTTKPKVQITVEKLKELMLGGMNRKQLAEHFNAPVSTINKFFKHPDLKNLRPKHASEFELVDDSGNTYSPGYLANAAKEEKEALAAQAQAQAGEDTNEQAEVAEQAPATVSESTGI